MNGDYIAIIDRKYCLYCKEWKFPWDVKRSEFKGQLRCKKCGKLGITTRHYHIEYWGEFRGLLTRDITFSEKFFNKMLNKK